MAVRRDLRELAKRDPAIAKSGLAAAALVLAAELDDVRTPGIALLALRQIADDDLGGLEPDEIARATLKDIGRIAGSSASEKAQCARVLLSTMDRLLELAPAQAAGADRLDELASVRAARLAG